MPSSSKKTVKASKYFFSNFFYYKVFYSKLLKVSSSHLINFTQYLSKLFSSYKCTYYFYLLFSGSRCQKKGEGDQERVLPKRGSIVVGLRK